MNQTITPLITEDEIARRVGELAEAIAAKLNESQPQKPVVIVGLLAGAFVFLADLARALMRHGVDPEIDFLTAKSYGDATQSSGQVTITGRLTIAIKDKRVLIVDDIIDTGQTYREVAALLAKENPAELLSVALLDKPARRTTGASADFVGFTIDDKFVVGYGLDLAGHYRGLPYIGYADVSDEGE